MHEIKNLNRTIGGAVVLFAETLERELSAKCRRADVDVLTEERYSRLLMLLV